MTRDQAKGLLLAYRPGFPVDPETQQALELAKTNAEVGRWLANHLQTQSAIQSRLREITPPPGLKRALLAATLDTKPRSIFWRLRPMVFSTWRPALALAAALVVFAGLAIYSLKPGEENRFSNFQSRIIGTALREYRMDIVTNNMEEVRALLASRGAPVDYQLPAGLRKAALTGGGALKWRNNPVSMVCFDRGDTQMIYLFVVKQSALKDPPPVRPRLYKDRDLLVASWTQGANAFLLAAPEGTDLSDKLPNL